MKHDSFQSRHIGPDTFERDEMLKVVGAPSLDALMDEVIPASIRLQSPLDLPAGQTESEYLRNLRQLAAQNQVFRSFIGLGSTIASRRASSSGTFSKTLVGTARIPPTKPKFHRGASKVF